MSTIEKVQEDVLVEEAIGINNEIVLHNDDVNTFDHVIETLIRVCKHDAIQAEQCATLVHYTGKCAVKQGPINKLKPICEALLEKGINAEVINIHTIKPLDVQAILASVKKTGCVVTAEEHQCNGGLGDSVAQYLALNHPTPMEFVGVNDSFGESGKPAELMEKYGLNANAIVEKAIQVMARK
jgi:deoxyxylulose-5-phosphate synthase